MRNLHRESKIWTKYKSLVVSDVMLSRDGKRQRKQQSTSHPTRPSKTLQICPPKEHAPIRNAEIVQQVARSTSSACFANEDILNVMNGGDSNASKEGPSLTRSMVVVSSGPVQLRKPIDATPVKGEIPFEDNVYWSSNPVQGTLKFIPRHPSHSLVRKDPGVMIGPLSSTKGPSFGLATKDSCFGGAYDLQW